MKFVRTCFDHAARRSLFPSSLTAFLVFNSGLGFFLPLLVAIHPEFVPVRRLSRFDAQGLVFQGSHLDRPLQILFSDQVPPYLLSQVCRTRPGSEKHKGIPDAGYRWDPRRWHHQNLNVVVVCGFPHDALRASGKDHIVARKRQVRLFPHCFLDVLVLGRGQRKDEGPVVPVLSVVAKIGEGNLVHRKDKGIQPLHQIGAGMPRGSQHQGPAVAVRHGDPQHVHHPPLGIQQARLAVRARLVDARPNVPRELPVQEVEGSPPGDFQQATHGGF
mmetsp:Transcript_20252/g.56283  ORF Transcript_20252/g.56283 Transcript_20252/m.56283 type:complete len:273 (+) Transcript_20252:1106-1924(+)